MNCHSPEFCSAATHQSLRARVIGALLSLVVLLSIPATAAALVTIPGQDTPVVDSAGMLDADTRGQLVDLLHDLKQQTGAQIKVLTVPGLDGEDIFAFAQRHYDLWKLGLKGQDKGALIVLAPAEHKVRIQVGYGLEGVLPDIWCGMLERSIAQKYFVRREYGRGLVELTQTVARRVADQAKVEINGLPAAGARDSHGDLLFWIIVWVLVYVYLYNLYRQWKNRGQGRRWGGTAPGWGWNVFPSGGRSSGGDWSGGSGGTWSGGGSDFGGGGSSGGGGASASW